MEDKSVRMHKGDAFCVQKKGAEYFAQTGTDRFLILSAHRPLV